MVGLRLVLLPALEHHFVELAALSAGAVEGNEVGRENFVRFELCARVCACGVSESGLNGFLST